MYFFNFWFFFVNFQFFSCIINMMVKVQFRDPSFIRNKGHYLKTNLTCLVSLCFHEQVGDTIVDGWPQLECNFNVFADMILPHGSHCIDMTASPTTALLAHGCHALQPVIGWELSCTCIVTSWSQHQQPKHGGVADRWGTTCHAYGRKFAIKVQC